MGVEGLFTVLGADVILKAFCVGAILGELNRLICVVGELICDDEHTCVLSEPSLAVITWRATRIPVTRKRLCFAARAFIEWIE